MDCGIAAIAMYLGHPYRVVSDAALKVSRRSHKSGLWVSEMLAVIRKFRDTAGRSKGTSLEDGILVLQKGRDRHFAVRFQSIVIDPASGCVWDEEAFLEAKRWIIREVLQ